MNPLHIVHVLTQDAQTECNPYKWQLALMLYAMHRDAHRAQPTPQAAPEQAAAAATPTADRSARA